MIVSNEPRRVCISEMRPGDVFYCLTTYEAYIVVRETIEIGSYMNCVRLSDGEPKNYCQGPKVEFYPSARIKL